MLHVEGLSYGVKERRILESVGLRVEPGEFVGVIGPNGSGKSTLLKNIYKVLRPQEGVIDLMGEDLTAMSEKKMAQRLAVVVQEHEGGFDFTVEEVVMMGRQARKGLLEPDSQEDRDLVERVLALTRLTPIRGQGFLTLSGGEKQRALIARALVQQTPCLILDEPTNHLDIKYQLELMDIVKELDITVISAIHDLNIAAMYCDRLYALKAGTVVGEGTPAELLNETFIREVYEVETQIITDRDGQIHILYRPGAGRRI